MSLPLFTCSSVCQAEDRVSGFRFEDDVADVSKGEDKRTKAFNLAGQLVGVTIKYKNGSVRNEKYEKGHLKLVHETDFKGWSRDIEMSAAGTLISECIRTQAGSSKVYVNVDALGTTAKDVHLAVGDELYLVYTEDPWPGSRADTVTTKNKAAITLLTASPKTPVSTKYVSAGGFSAATAGDNEVTVKTVLTYAGFPGPKGKAPRQLTLNVTIKVHVK